MIKTRQLATAQEAEPSGNPGPNDVYYTATSRFSIPSSFTKVLISGNNTGTGSDSKIGVDDKARITINPSNQPKVILDYDYSKNNTGVYPTDPIDVTTYFNQYKGQEISIKIEFIDLHPGSHGGSAYWLLIS